MGYNKINRFRATMNKKEMYIGNWYENAAGFLFIQEIDYDVIYFRANSKILDRSPNRGLGWFLYKQNLPLPREPYYAQIGLSELDRPNIWKKVVDEEEQAMLSLRL